MTVGEMIDLLSIYPRDTKVFSQGDEYDDSYTPAWISPAMVTVVSSVDGKHMNYTPYSEFVALQEHESKDNILVI